MGVSLIEGDMDLSATGTVTHIDNGRVYAFGHPFYNLGPTQFPMRKAYVYSVFPSLYQSWKISSAADAVGTIEQDRITAVAGMIGKSPKMIPVEVKIKTSRGPGARVRVPHGRGRAVQPGARLRRPGLRAAEQRARVRHLDASASMPPCP